MSAQNQAAGELRKVKGETKDTVKNPPEDFKQDLGGFTEGLGGTVGQTGRQPKETAGQNIQWTQPAGKTPAGTTWERDIGELIKSIRDSTDRFAESVRESAKSEMTIAGLLKDIHESTNKLADDVRESAKREATTADQIKNIKESTDRLAENIRESAGETEMQGRQGEQHEQQSGGQLQDTGGQAERARISLEQATEPIKTLVEHYMKSSETFQEEVTKTAKRMQRGIRK